MAFCSIISRGGVRSRGGMCPLWQAADTGQPLAQLWFTEGLGCLEGGL